MGVNTQGENAMATMSDKATLDSHYGVDIMSIPDVRSFLWQLLECIDNLETTTELQWLSEPDDRTAIYDRAVTHLGEILSDAAGQAHTASDLLDTDPRARWVGQYLTRVAILLERAEFDYSVVGIVRHLLRLASLLCSTAPKLNTA